MSSDHRYARNVLRMVQELHLRGYQRLRIAPGMSPSGIHWRCALTPVSNIEPRHGARLIDWDNAAHYGSGADDRYFDWTDARHATPSQLANLFVTRFPNLAASARGSDWPYAGWYAEMLGLTYPDAFPIAYADWELPLDHLACVGGAEVRVPLPPLAPNEPRSLDRKPTLVVAGVDGCKSGWLCIVERPDSHTLEARIFPTFRDLLSMRPEPAVIAIDIPIGLPDRGARPCDLEARRKLGATRGSSVFPAPIRPVLGASNYADASVIRRAHDGAGMSRQAFGILGKVREVDSVLSLQPDWQSRVREVHPEVSFAEWAGQPMSDAKRSASGRAAREALIDSTWPGVRHRLSASLGRGGWQADDLNDSFAALWTARRLASKKAKSLSPEPVRDATGKFMDIVY